MRIQILLREEGETLIHGARSQNRARRRNTHGWRYALMVYTASIVKKAVNKILRETKRYMTLKLL